MQGIVTVALMEALSGSVGMETGERASRRLHGATIPASCQYRCVIGHGSTAVRWCRVLFQVPLSGGRPVFFDRMVTIVK